VKVKVELEIELKEDGELKDEMDVELWIENKVSEIAEVKRIDVKEIYE